MEWASPLMIGQLITLLIMAVALGLDALSLGIGIGMRGIRKLHIIKLSLLIALFHMVMPLVGMLTGGYVGLLLGGVATKAGGILLVLLGVHMVYSSLKGEHAISIDHKTTWGMVLFALSVSIDSFSVGVSLGMFAGDMILTVILFGAVGGLMSIFGLMLGRKVGHWVGEYGEAMGGVILLAFGINFLL
ncbi:manganese efflux pump MntP family protein [Paenibacillus radicis (ex Xue et al. 2023)]|uniref:Putative manganese efflux pump MntP n=1 Tax=Paenibacillus radicis (ex Xue et al. 2023) TaxID=2972489 RepID=A0ABT1YH64_9BACL|nr:manganese efflux pump MntP family protein [Paenibacillus radicis (ex Xue et al. 2023)]MCR8632307.1 manganese efflux pump MntP family protein [Paenibacillus radicis (ex Xue et al. 2023)]